MFHGAPSANKFTATAAVLRAQCAIMALLLFAATATMTAHVIAAPPAPPPPPASLGIWSKVLLTDAVAQSGARCLDGSPGSSPGGYYVRTHNAKGEAADPKKWIVFMQGGGWCSSDENCAERAFGANNSLGSSTQWGPTSHERHSPVCPSRPPFHLAH